MYPNLGDLSLAGLLYFSLVAFCTGFAVLGSRTKADRALKVLRLLLCKRER